MNVNLLTATQTVEKTMAFVFYRWLVFLALAVGFVMAALAGAGTAIAVFSFSADPTTFANVGAVFGFTAFGWLLYRFWGSVEMAVLTPHLLLLSKATQGETLPTGKAQIQCAKQAMADRLPAATEPRALYGKVKAVLSALPRLAGIALLPRTHPRLTPVIERITAWLSALNADVVIARAGTTSEPGPWQLARSGILRQARDAKIYLTQRGYVMLFVLAGGIVAYAVLLVPSLKIAAALPFPASFWPYVVAGVFSWNLKASFLDPIAQAAMIRLDLGLDSSEPGPQVSEQLADSIAEFRDITARANASH